MAQNMSPQAAPDVPDGTQFVASLKKSLHAAKLQPGDKVEFDAAAATLIAHQTVIPANAVFHGHVLQAEAAESSVQKESRLSIVVDSVTWKNHSVPVCASISGFGSREVTVARPIQPRSATDPTWRPGMSPLPTAQLQVSTETPLENFNSPLMREMMSVPETTTIGWRTFVEGVEIHRSPTAISVLTRKKKNVDLPGGLLVALQQLQGTKDGCPAVTAR